MVSCTPLFLGHRKAEAHAREHMVETSCLPQEAKSRRLGEKFSWDKIVPSKTFCQ